MFKIWKYPVGPTTVTLLIGFGALGSFAKGAFAHNSFEKQCFGALDRPLSSAVVDHYDNRMRITAYALEKGLPSFQVMIHGRWVPVILINKTTYKEWDWILKSSMGIGQTMHPGVDADHGYARLPGSGISEGATAKAARLLKMQTVDGVRTDLLGPVVFENRDSGVRFLRMSEYLSGKTYVSHEGVELVYALSHQQQLDFWAYHLMKELGLVYVGFSFTPGYVKNSVKRRAIVSTSPRDLLNGLENCNNFRCGAEIQKHIGEIEHRMSRYFKSNASQLATRQDVHTFYHAGLEAILNRDWAVDHEWDPNFLEHSEVTNYLNDSFREGLSREEKGDGAAYLLAWLISQRQKQLRDQLRIVEGRSNQYGNGNISTIFIYSERIPHDVFLSGQVKLDHAYEWAGNNGFSSDYFFVRRSSLSK